jgi:REP-associated tyrosine transposase
MPRVARIVVPGVPHHITQRGNNRQRVFFTDEHRSLYLDLLKKHATQFGLQIWAYCLMENHIHLVATPRSADSLANAIGRTDFRYAQQVNRDTRRSGHLWQNRFYSCALEDVHLWRAMRYVERNPVRAGLVRVAWRYRWSSAAAHVSGVDATGLLDMAAWREQWKKSSRWAEALRDPDDEGRELLCGSTRTGRPLGGKKFVAGIERLLDRRVQARPVGRPKRQSPS